MRSNEIPLVDFLLLGGGLASATAAETLRAAGAEGSIAILCAEATPPYHRPPLSKSFLLNGPDQTKILIHDVGAHHLSRKLKAFGHDARLMPAKYVRPYSKGQKNDFRDAEAIAEAVQRPTMKFVATKTAEQLDLQALHRVRKRLVSQRTGIINQIRAFLLERGVAVRQGLRFLRAELPRILATPPDVLSPRMVRVIKDLAEDWRRLDERVDDLSNEIAVLARRKRRATL